MKFTSSHRWVRIAGVAGVVLIVAMTTAAVGSTAAYVHGISGYSGQSRALTCSSCHSGGAPVRVALSGPQFVLQGSQRSFGLTISGGQQMGGGLDVASDAGTLVATDRGTTVMRGEITQLDARNADRNGDVSFGFDLVAPRAPATVTLFGDGCSVDLDGRAGGDSSAVATASVTVVDNLTRFVPFGEGLPGSGGFVPVLSGTDGPSVGPWSMEIADGLGGATGVLFVGVATSDNSRLRGGHFYIDLTQRWSQFAITLGGGAGRPGAGSLEMRGVDVSVYAPLVLYWQAAIVDPGARRGVSLSNGLEMDIEK
jgi:hypothetical protein